MRYVFLLLILCISFGVLDSVTRAKPLADPSSASPSAFAIKNDRFAGLNQFSAYIQKTMGARPRRPHIGASRMVPGTADNIRLSLAVVDAIAVSRPQLGAPKTGSPAMAEADPSAIRANRGLSSVDGGLKDHDGDLASDNGTVGARTNAARAILGAGSAGAGESETAAASGNSSLSQTTGNDFKGGTMEADRASLLANGEAAVSAAVKAPVALDFSRVSEKDARSPLPEIHGASFAQYAKDQTVISVNVHPIHNALMDSHKVQFGGLAALNWSGASASGNSGKVSGKPLTGFNLGVFADVRLRKSFSFRPQVTYSYEGYQPNVGGDKINIHVASLKTSLNLVYHTHLLNDRFFVGAGPFVGANINGTYSLKGINTDMSFGNNYSNGDNLRRMDYGASVTAGLLMDKNFVLGTSFDLGLRNMGPDGFNTQIHSRSFGLTMMYVFRNRTIF